MNKIISALSPEAVKVIRQSYPVVRKRTPLWFYMDEIKSKQTQNLTGEKIKKSDILRLWAKMDPESKRKYFNMAHFDEVRYKEQKSLWMARVGTLLARHGGQIDKLVESVPDMERLNKEFLATFDKYQKNYAKMIQTETTKWLYKDVIDRVEKLESNLTAEEVISAVPEDHRAVLIRPRKPLSPFLLFIEDNREKFMQLCKSMKNKVPLLTKAGQEWSKLDKEERKVYNEKYSSHLAEYYKAMQRFRANNPNAKDGLLGQASREKRSFKKSLRRRLHEFVTVPVNVRNAFNFFVMDQSNSGIGLKELTKIWHELPEDDKLKYRQMCDEDTMRYYKDKAEYDEFMNKFKTELFSKGAI